MGMIRSSLVANAGAPSSWGRRGGGVKWAADRRSDPAGTALPDSCSHSYKTRVHCATLHYKRWGHICQGSKRPELNTKTRRYGRRDLGNGQDGTGWETRGVIKLANRQVNRTEHPWLSRPSLFGCRFVSSC